MDLPKQYDPTKKRELIYQKWETNGHFKASTSSNKPPFSIVMPPPNITGVLHMGHALVSTVQDVIVRWKRMSGFETLWVPGIDHAGISTQTVVERHLMKEYGKRRTEFSRQEFIDHIWDWKREKEKVIQAQLRAMGCSCDWSRYRFTMDEEADLAVRKVFKRLFDQGLIYRGNYLVNWDPVTQTALADDEVEYIERKSSMWTIRYPLAEEEGVVSVSTTRPETMLGDTAVAVHPDDGRYHHLIGKKVRLPITNRLIPIIGDHDVDPEFGTGAVKITPSHDPNDYKLGHRHQLEFINIMTPDGRINENGGEFEGLTMEQARQAVAEKLQTLGALERITPHVHRVGISYRSKAVIEPYMSEQWFIRMDGFKEALHKAVSQGKLKLIPELWKHTYFHWVDNLRDWCISRQLWWGHQMPIWYNKENPEEMICHDGPGEPPEAKGGGWIQDPDALDTWFSSALWPFSTLGWPEKTAELERFYPNSVLMTGHDILFFWVARMALMGSYVMEELPFPETFLTGLIFGRSYWREDPEGGVHYLSEEERIAYDKGAPVPPDVHSKWEKLSKSKGNAIDPLNIIEEYGCDAMRMALCVSGPENSQIDLDRRKFEEFKNFANKIWNGARFAFLNLEGQTEEELSMGLDLDLLGSEDHWILAKLNERINSVTTALDAYSFDHAAMTAYDFFWNEFCAYYVEAIKPHLFGKQGTPEERSNKQKVLVIVLCQALRLLHPFAPYITEELFEVLQEQFSGVVFTEGVDPYTEDCIQALMSDACIVAPFPKPIALADTKKASHFDRMQEIVYQIRNIRGEMKLPLGSRPDITIVGDDLAIIEAHTYLIHALVKCGTIECVGEEPDFPFASTGVVGSIKVMIPLPEELQVEEKKRLEKEQRKLEESIERIQGQLGNKNYVQRAPEHLVKKTRGQLKTAQEELSAVLSKLDALR